MRRVIATALMAAPLISHAYELERAMVNMADDLADCVAYYTIVSADISQRLKENPNDKTEKLFNDYQQGVNTAVSLMQIYMVSQPEKHLQSKIDLHMQTNIRRLGEEGMDRLIFLYSDSCKAMVQSPNDRLDYWLKK